ncbi:hypothetical protein [Streptomyces halobius]|uniref:Peptidase S74 domain-containing protein n=1 Tax=Streptomyces halobius TaxID=2879846 RepID=A0ABY4MK85_9ACTN|nr:hypothetical protein [Streptomyces halobius]UQA97124.1 hypothetical protein K9S39_39370 [Streptomyces halobius]
MTVGKMNFGTTNDAGGDVTSLVSTSFSTLLVYGHQGSGITGRSDPGNGVNGVSQSGVGLFGETTTGIGARGLALDSSTGATGVLGESRGLNGNGVVGVAFNGTNAYGIWGQGGDGWAGWFSGKVHVSGTLTKGAGGFLIDHPLDPENRYLLHSFVESAERLNMYSGTVVTDADGAAVIELPEYFEALNEDFRYQLTAIGTFAQAIVTDEVRDNRFTIATDRPEVKVSWQVSGVRRDPFARANPLRVGEEKPEEERGTYVHPEAWGKPTEAGADFARAAALHEQVESLKPAEYRMPPSVGGEQQA